MMPPSTNAAPPSVIASPTLHDALGGYGIGIDIKALESAGKNPFPNSSAA